MLSPPVSPFFMSFFLVLYKRKAAASSPSCLLIKATVYILNISPVVDHLGALIPFLQVHWTSVWTVYKTHNQHWHLLMSVSTAFTRWPFFTLLWGVMTIMIIIFIFTYLKLCLHKRTFELEAITIVKTRFKSTLDELKQSHDTAWITFIQNSIQKPI